MAANLLPTADPLVTESDGRRQILNSHNRSRLALPCRWHKHPQNRLHHCSLWLISNRTQ